MTEHFKKWWAVYGHTLTLGLVAFLDPSVHAWVAAHPGQALVAGIWTYVLHLLQSPLG